MFETEEKTNKALAGTQRRGRLAAICRSTGREAPQEGSQSHGRGEHPLGRAAREGLTWCEAGFGAKAAPAGPTLGPGCMNDPKHLIHPSRDRHQDTGTETCPRLPGRSSLLAAHLALPPLPCCSWVWEGHLVPSRRCSLCFLWLHTTSRFSTCVLSFFPLFPSIFLWNTCWMCAKVINWFYFLSAWYCRHDKQRKVGCPQCWQSNQHAAGACAFAFFTNVCKAESGKELLEMVMHHWT